MCSLNCDFAEFCLRSCLQPILVICYSYPSDEKNTTFDKEFADKFLSSASC